MMGGAGRRGYQAVNRKAEEKLDVIVRKLLYAAGEDAELAIDSKPLARTFSPRCCSEVGAITVRYQPQNKFFATLYDLSFEFSVAGPKAPGCSIELAPGSMKLVSKGNGEGSSHAGFSDDLLDNELIEARLRLLGATRLSAVCEGSAGCWNVGLSTMVGSATWNLIPPVMHLIEPTNDECLRAFELLELLAVAIRSSAEPFCMQGDASCCDS